MGFTPDINDASPFTLSNIPFGVISTQMKPNPHCATAIGDHALDLSQASAEGLFDNLEGHEIVVEAFSEVRTPHPSCLLSMSHAIEPSQH